jgi:Planctomycete cytochrome C/Anaphase-promoting complex subunit 4 WD40 domain
LNFRNRQSWFVVVSVVTFAAGAARADENRKANYQDDLVPLLRESCFGCHNADKAKGNLNLTSYSTLMQGGSSGAAIEPGDPGASYLYQLVTHQSEPHMPLNSAKLPEEKLAIFRRFIEDGALESSGSKPQMAKAQHAELKLAGAPTDKPDGPSPMPPRLPLEPMLQTSRAGAVTALAASPWAPLVAIAGQEQVLLFNTDSLDLIGVLPFPEGTPHVLRFSRNGKLLLAGGGHEAKSGRVVLWDVTTGKRITEIGDEYDVVLAADISPDQSMVALSGPSKVVRIFSTASGELMQQIKKHTDWVTAIQFGPDNVLLATADRGGEIVVWEAATAREYLALHGHTAGVMALSWRADGNVLASAGDDSSIRLWEVENGKQTKTWNAHGGVQWLDFARDGRIVSCGRDRQIKLWTADGKQQSKDMPMSDLAMRAVLAADGKRIIAGDWAGEARVFDAADGKQFGTISPNPPKLAERWAAAEKTLSAQRIEEERLVAMAAVSMEASNKAAAELATAQQGVAEAVAAEKRGKADVEQAKQTVARTTEEMQSGKGELANQKTAAEALADSLAKARQAAEKAPEDGTLAEAIEKLKAANDGLTAKVAATEKALGDKTEALSDAQSKFVEAEKQLEKTASDIEQARKQVEKLTPAAKEVADKAGKDKNTAEQATAKRAAAEAEASRWRDEIDFAKSVAK